MKLITMINLMLEGMGGTCAIFFLTLLFSLPLGMVVALLRMSKNKVVSNVTRAIISVLRGTPLMLQLVLSLRVFRLQKQAYPGRYSVCDKLRGVFCRDLPQRHRVYPRRPV